MEKPNKLMTWEKMVKEYPGKWVVVEKIKGNLSTIREGIVRYVANDDEISDIWCKCLDEGMPYDKRRTTTESFMGIVDGVNFEVKTEVIPK